jgi:hypothetical protein
MPDFTFTSPEGKSYTVSGPDGATQEQAFGILQGQIGDKGGNVSKSPEKSAAGEQTRSWGDVGAQALENAPASAMNFAKGLAQPFIDPVGTAKGIQGVVGGTMDAGLAAGNAAAAPYLPSTSLKEGSFGGRYQHAVEDQKAASAQSGFAGGKEEIPAAVVKHFDDRYGGIENIKKTIGEDPIGALGDVSAALTLGGGAAARAPGILGKVGEIAQTAGDLANPVMAPVKAASAAVGAARPLLDPLTAAGQQRIADRTLSGSFTDPKRSLLELEAAKATQQPGAGMGEIVPGSKPTTGQLTGDQGALQLERSIANQDRTSFHENQAGTGADQQNAARAAALGGIQPGGAATDVSDQIRKGLSDIEKSQDQAVQDAQNKARAASAGIGSGATPEAQGASLRAALQSGRDAAKTNERKLWSAIDPDGTLALPADPVTSAAGKISQSIPRTAKPMGGEEAAIFDTAANLPSIAPFTEMTALRSRISTALREELMSAGQSPTYARLTQLRGAVEDAIHNAAVHRSAQESADVASGALSAEDTIAARIQSWVESHYENSARASGSRAVGSAAAGSPGSFSAPRTESPARVGLGGDAGAPGVPGQAPAQTIVDADASARLKAASAATKERAQTFDSGPVGDVLRKGSGSADYRLPDSAVPGKVWAPGPRGAETVQAYGNAAGSKSAIQEAAAESLRREAMTSEGIIDPGKFASWKKRYADAIRALPKDVQASFNNADSASRAYEEAAAARKEAIDASQTGMAKKLAGLSSSQDITRTVAGIFGSKDSIGQMRELVDKLKGSPAAIEGLKKAIADHVVSLATSTAEAGASGVNKVNASTFQKFVAKNEASLKVAGFSESQISNMRAIANDLQRSQRTMQATSLPAGPNTASDLLAAGKKAGKEGGSIWWKLLAGAAGEALYTGHYSAAATGGALALAAAMRARGMSKVSDLLQAGILDPEIGRQMLRRASESADGSSERSIAKALARKSVFVASGSSASASNSSVGN